MQPIKVTGYRNFIVNLNGFSKASCITALGPAAKSHFDETPKTLFARK
jgi:hypothetical protein